MIRLGTPERRRRVRRALLESLGPEGRASLFFLRSETGFTEEEILRCAVGLEREGLVSVEGRPDGNTSRQMLALTARGRARDVSRDAEVDAGTTPVPTPRKRTNDESGEGGTR